MTQPKLIGGLSEVASHYDAVLCDIWGVVHNGRARHQAACEALVRFREQRGPVVLISNAPRPATAVIAQLDALGVPRGAWTAVVTSGDATRAALSERAPGPVWVIGPERDKPLFEGVELTYAGPDTAAFICCTGLIDDHHETAEDYRERLLEPARRGLEFICANPDRVVQIGDRLIPCAGAVADIYEALGGTVIMEGKPFTPIYDLALEAVTAAGGPAGRDRVLAIGDGIATDVRGANGQGLPLLFVAEGIHGQELAGADGALDPVLAAARLEREGARADYLAPALAW